MIIRRIQIIAVAAFSMAVASVGNAETFTGNPCSLINWQDLKPLGAKKTTTFADAGWHEEKSPTELPDSQLFTDLCGVTILSKAGRTSATLTFTSFRGNVTEQQIGDWLKSVAQKETPDPDIKAETVDEAGCEKGHYDLPTSQSDGSVAKVVEHYVACDRQVGTQHVSLNISFPQGKHVSSFSARQTKSLLDKAISRMTSLPSVTVEKRVD